MQLTNDNTVVIQDWTPGLLMLLVPLTLFIDNSLSSLWFYVEGIYYATFLAQQHLA